MLLMDDKIKSNIEQGSLIKDSTILGMFNHIYVRVGECMLG